MRSIRLLGVQVAVEGKGLYLFSRHNLGDPLLAPSCHFSITKQKFIVRL